ncbi:MAG: hypothetical protein ACFFE8_16150 [Candidatus Heimdallarchaeota archaeon]
MTAKKQKYVIFLNLVMVLLISAVPQLEVSSIPSETPEYLDDEGVRSIFRVILTKEGDCLVFYTVPTKNNPNIVKSYVRVLRLFLDGSSSYITPRYDCPPIGSASYATPRDGYSGPDNVGLIQEDENSLRVISWYNGSLYEIWYDKKEETLDVIDKGHFFDIGVCSFAYSRYEWGINEYFVIGNYNDYKTPYDLDLVLADMNSVEIKTYALPYDYTYVYSLYDTRGYVFWQVSNSLGYYPYRFRNKSNEIIIQEVRIDGGELNEVKSFKIPFKDHFWFLIENQTPYLIMQPFYYINETNTEQYLVNLQENQEVVLQFSAYPNWHAYPPRVIIGDEGIIHAFVVYDVENTAHMDAIHFEYTKFNPDGSIKHKQELDLNLLANINYSGKTPYFLPIDIQEYSSNLIAIIGFVNFTIINGSTGNIISSGPTNFYDPSITKTRAIDYNISPFFLVTILILGINRKRRHP